MDGKLPDLITKNACNDVPRTYRREQQPRKAVSDNKLEAQIAEIGWTARQETLSYAVSAIKVQYRKMEEIIKAEVAHSTRTLFNQFRAEIKEDIISLKRSIEQQQQFQEKFAREITTGGEFVQLLTGLQEKLQAWVNTIRSTATPEPALTATVMPEVPCSTSNSHISHSSTGVDPDEDEIVVLYSTIDMSKLYCEYFQYLIE